MDRCQVPPKLPPGRLIGPWPACATCQSLTQSQWGDGQRQTPTSLSSSWPPCLCSDWGRDMEMLSFTGKRDNLLHQPLVFLSSYTLPSVSSSRRIKRLSCVFIDPLAHSFLCPSWYCSPSSYLLSNCFLLHHHPTYDQRGCSGNCSAKWVPSSALLL